MPAHSPSHTLELYDLDGTLNSIDVPGALDGKGSPEVTEYINAAVTFLTSQIPELKRLEVDVLRKIQGGMRLIFPQRSKLEYWATFPNTDKQQTKICPAVDHYLLTPHAVRACLNSYLQVLDADNPLHQSITRFLATNWQYPLYAFCSAATLEHAAIDENAQMALDGRLTRDGIIVVFTNSKPQKAEIMLRKAGF